MGMFVRRRIGAGTDHGEFQRRLDAYAAGELDDVDWLMMRTHLAECAHCRSQLCRPALLNRAAPQRILADHAPGRRTMRDTAPGWTIVLGVVLVAALVAFSIGYALGGV
ncbi:zf-HC2 domain-containing protein [Saccharopolyspora sp. TS4A08]|uniref:Zf-HC2 domain-containing protein n=1 Tax=Saccharopolyspora ipomoeae TaxID=3042027 RepID=A0ABT6PKL5_9PSEU|nr:zf-HC2 domain-containing protein [Saccharopolyspora sp. TS4A08]MDI2028531.1 zf-HC2 domain-containing protein [Saccharopolyspora sp. TS4A08]